MPGRGARAGRIAAALAVVLALASARALAVPEGNRAPGDPASEVLVTMVKTPVLWFTRVAVTQYRVEQNVSSSILHIGVDVFTGIVRWFSRDAVPKPGSILPRQL